MISLFAAAAIAFPITDTGKPAAVIAALPANAPVEVQRAVSELQRVIEKMSGAKLPITNAPAQPTIHVGRDAFVEAAGLKLDALDEDGFVIQTVGNHDLILAGRQPHGTEFAVYRFLQKHGGVRWYFPTDLGEVVPQRASFGIGPVADREEPSYLSRRWSSAATFDRGEWEQRNFIRSRYEFHHNLLRVFTPSKYYDGHPEWFPEINGKRVRPKDDNDHHWQPCLSNPAVARHAAAVARDYFDQHPGVTSFSIGMNDTAAGGFCECKDCRALDPTDPKEQQTPRGQPNYSNRFYTFANRAAAELAKTHPDKYLGCLAYHVTEPPPTFAVNPHIIPYLTGGRANWTDPAIREGDQTLIRGWCRKVPIVGIYDYYYGSGFVIPRLFTSLTEDSLKFAHTTGVRAFYAEIYSTWSLDGPKAWVASQLLWNVNQSADALVDDFCHGLFGKAAGPMREYFRYCEQRWLSRPSGSTTMWDGFFDIRQLDLWPPDSCARARAILAKAEQAAQSESNLVRRRVQLYSDGFRQTELWSALHHGGKNLRAIEDVANYVAAQEQLEKLKSEVIRPNPLHRAPIPFEERARNLPGGSMLGALLRMADQPGAEAVLRRVIAQHGAGEVGAAARAALRLREHPEQAIQKLADPGFEGPAGKSSKTAAGDTDLKTPPPGWGVWFRPNTPGELRWSRTAKRGGERGVLLRGATAGCVLQDIKVKPGEAYLASVYVRGAANAKTEAELLIQWKDESGKWLSSAGRRADRLPAGGSTDWTRLAVFVQVPPGAGRLVFGVTTYNQPEQDILQMDDASLQLLP